MFHQFYDPNIKLFPWVPEMVQELSKENTLAVLSSSTKTSVTERLGDSAEHFFRIYGSREVINLKPSPEGVHLILNDTGYDKKDAIMIGDMIVDYFAAKNAGIKTGLVKWGMGDWDELVALNADIYFQKPKELLSISF